MSSFSQMLHFIPIIKNTAVRYFSLLLYLLILCTSGFGSDQHRKSALYAPIRAYKESPPPTHTKTTFRPPHRPHCTTLTSLILHRPRCQARVHHLPYNMVKRPSIHSCFRPFRAAFSCQCCQSLQVV